MVDEKNIRHVAASPVSVCPSGKACNVPDLLPSIFLILQFALLIDPARPNFFKQSNQTRASRSAVDPNSQWGIFRLSIPGFKKPPENRLFRRDVDVAGVRFHAGSELADSLRDFLVAYSLVVVSFCRGEVGRRGDELTQREWEDSERRCGSSPGRHLEVTRYLSAARVLDNRQEADH